MNIYLPIAEMSVAVLLFVGMGAAVGFLSGMFGVGGGFLMTPLLIFSGMPSAVAVGTEAAQIVASSVSGALAQWRRNNVDFKMGTVLLVGGVAGSVLGVQAVKILRQAGQFDLFISLSYVMLLGTVGTLMLVESLTAIRKSRAGKSLAVRARASTAGCTACRSRCGSIARSSTSAQSRRWRSAPSSASWPASWASAAASSWCRP